MTADELLMLAVTGGSIVCSSQCSVEELDKARATGRFYMAPEKGTKWGWGFCFMPAEQKTIGAGEPAPATVDP